jgi:hypothetical protein
MIYIFYYAAAMMRAAAAARALPPPRWPPLMPLRSLLPALFRHCRAGCDDAFRRAADAAAAAAHYAAFAAADAAVRFLSISSIFFRRRCRCLIDILSAAPCLRRRPPRHAAAPPRADFHFRRHLFADRVLLFITPRRYAIAAFIFIRRCHHFD